MDKEKSVSSLSSKESIDVKQTLKSLYVKAGLSGEIHLSFLIPEGVHISAEKGRKRPFFFSSVSERDHWMYLHFYMQMTFLNPASSLQNASN